MQPLHRGLNGYLVHHLGARQEAAARRAVADGKRVACLTADAAVLGRLDGVTVLPEGALPPFAEVAAVPGSLDLAEAAALRLLARRPAVTRRLAKLAGGDEELRCYLGRTLQRTVADLNALSLLVSTGVLASCERVELDRHWPGGPQLGLVLEVDAPREPALVLGDPPGTVRSVAGALRSALALWRDWLPRVRVRGAAWEPRPLLLRHYDEDWGLDRGGQARLRNFDFLVDGEAITERETTILSEPSVPPEHDEQLRARGYAVVRRAGLTVGAGRFLWRIVPRLARSSLLLLWAALADGAWREPASVLAAEVVLWEEAAHRLRPRLFLAYNDLHPSGLARTLGLRRAGCLNALYEYSCSWLFDDRGWLPDFAFAFDVADRMVTWGALHTDNIRAHRGLVGEWWEVGCLWSEHARLVREEPELRERYRGLVEQATGVELASFERVVAVFDSSADPYLLDSDDLAAFYDGIVAVAAERPGTLFLCKPKRSLERRFAETANLVVLNEFFETAAVIGLCDASVSACFTSTGVETLGAGLPAVYFDPTNRFPDAFFRRVPGFVALDAGELGARLDELVAAGPAETSARLRERYAALEGRFDGRAMTRARAEIRAVLDG